MITDLYEDEIRKYGKDAQKYMQENYPQGVSREELKIKEKYYDDYYNRNLGAKSNSKSDEGLCAKWVLYLSENEFIKPEDICDKVIEDYVKSYNCMIYNYIDQD